MPPTLGRDDADGVGEETVEVGLHPGPRHQFDPPPRSWWRARTRVRVAPVVEDPADRGLRACSSPSTRRRRAGRSRWRPPRRVPVDRVDTAARQDGANWTVSGAKSIVPAGDKADAFIVPARVSGAVDDPAGIALFLVERAPRASRPAAIRHKTAARAAEVNF